MHSLIYQKKKKKQQAVVCSVRTKVIPKLLVVGTTTF